MDFRDLVKGPLEEYKAHLGRALEGLSGADLRWQPKPGATHIQWLSWQIARLEDRWVIGYIRGDEEVWVARGWYEAFRLSRDAWGYGMTADEVVGMPTVSVEQLRSYHEEVRAAGFEIIDSLTEADLETAHSEAPRNPDAPKPGPPVARALAHLVAQQGQYTGNVRFIRGLLHP